MSSWEQTGIPPLKWINYSPLAIICHFKGHKPGPWRDTYQPHVEQRNCSRCGGWQSRPKRRMDPSRLP